MLLAVAMVKSIKAVDAGPECAICEFVMKEVESLLGKNATEAEVEAALEKVCGFLPATIKDECDSFVQAYTPAIINLILQNVQPDEICSKIGLCTSSTVNLGATKPVPTKEKVVWVSLNKPLPKI
jgi:saposin